MSNKPAPARLISKTELEGITDVGMLGLCDALQVTATTIHKWIKEGMPVKSGGNGRPLVFNLSKCINWRVIRAQTDMKNSLSGGLDNLNSIPEIHESKRRKEHAQALLSELELANATRKVANIDDLMVNFARAISAVRSSLISQPSRMSGILSYKDDEVISDYLKKDVDSILNHLTDYEHEFVTYRDETSKHT